MKILSERKRVTVKENRIEFDYNNPKWDGGFSFDADENWKPVFTNEYAKKNYEACMAGEMDVSGPYNRTIEHSYIESATGECKCGNVVSLYDQYMGACECPNCGRWHNLFGQELKNPMYWERDEEDY